MDKIVTSPEKINTSPASRALVEDARLRRAASRARVQARLMAEGFVPRSLRGERRLLNDVLADEPQPSSLLSDAARNERVKARLIAEGFVPRHKADRSLETLMSEDAEFIGALAAQYLSQI